MNRLPISLSTGLAGALLLLAILSLSACEHGPAATPAAAAAPSPGRGAALAGVQPSSDLRGASDETGAAALGATDSGPGRLALGAAPEPTGGDGSPR